MPHQLYACTVKPQNSYVNIPYSTQRRAIDGPTAIQLYCLWAIGGRRYVMCYLGYELN